MPVCLDNPSAKGVPAPLPVVADLGLQLRLHARVVEAPFDELTPAVKRHILAAGIYFVKVVG